MKIHYITNSRIPTEKAHGTQIVKMCEAFGLQSIDVDLVVPTRRNRHLQHVNVYEHYALEQSFSIKRLNTFDPRFIFQWNLPQGTYIKVQTLLFLWSLYRYLSKITIDSNDIAYTRDPYLLPVLLKFFNTVVWEAHVLPRTKNRHLRFWKKCKHIVAISNGLADDLKSLGIESEKIAVAPDGVDLAMFHPFEGSDPTEMKKNLGLPLDKHLVLYTGHLYNWKGVDVLAEATRYLDADTVVAFLGGNDNAITSFRKKYENMGDRMLVVGRVAHHKVVQYLQCADVLVLPNLSTTEIGARHTSPLKLFEYMAVGKPIVASNVPAIREILSANSAVLVEPDNPKKLAEGLALVLNNESLADRLGSQVYTKVQTYDWRQRARRIIEFIGFK